MCLSIFTFEVVLKVYAFGLYQYFSDGWNVFDVAIVVISYIDSGIFSVFRLARVLRIFRVFRVLRLIKRIEPLRKIVQGLLKALPSLAWLLLLMLLVVYIYAVLGVILYRDTEFRHFFASVGDAMFTLFQIMTLEGWAGSCDPPIFKYRKTRVQDGENPIVSGDPNCIDGIARPIYKNMEGAHWFYFVSYILITAYCLMNIFTGVFVESMMRSRYEKDSANVVVAKLKASHAEFRAAGGTAKKKMVRAGKTLSKTITARLSLRSPNSRSSSSSAEKSGALPVPIAGGGATSAAGATDGAEEKRADDGRAASLATSAADTAAPAPAPAPAGAPTGAKPTLSFMQVLAAASPTSASVQSAAGVHAVGATSSPSLSKKWGGLKTAVKAGRIKPKTLWEKFKADIRDEEYSSTDEEHDDDDVDDDAGSARARDDAAPAMAAGAATGAAAADGRQKSRALGAKGKEARRRRKLMEAYEGTPLMGLYQELASQRDEREEDRHAVARLAAELARAEARARALEVRGAGARVGSRRVHRPFRCVPHACPRPSTARALAGEARGAARARRRAAQGACGHAFCAVHAGRAARDRTGG